MALKEKVERLASEKTDAQKEKAAEQASLCNQIAHLEDSRRPKKLSKNYPLSGQRSSD